MRSTRSSSRPSCGAEASRKPDPDRAALAGRGQPCHDAPGMGQRAARIAVVTGAGSGIGRATALALLGDGWRVALAGRHRAALMETARLAGRARARTLVVPTDVSDPAAVAA